MTYLTPKVERFSLHYDEQRAVDDARYSAALQRLTKEVSGLTVANRRPLFVYVSDSGSRIDLTFSEEVTLKECRRWIELIEVWFAGFLEE